MIWGLLHGALLVAERVGLGDVLARYKKVLIPELNTGQLRMLIRARYLVDAQGYNKVEGRPFNADEMLAQIFEHLGTGV